MVDNLTNMVHRDLHLTNNDPNHVHSSGNTGRSLHPQLLLRRPSDSNNPQLLSRKLSDSNNNSNQNQHHHHHHQHSLQNPPSITTTDYCNPSPFSGMRVSKDLFNRRGSDSAAYDTDGEIGSSESTLRRHRENGNNYGYLASSGISPHRAMAQSPKQLSAVPLHQRSSQRAHLAIDSSFDIAQNHDDRDGARNYEGDAHRRHIRHSRRIHQVSPSGRKQGAHIHRVPALLRHHVAFGATSPENPLRLIFVRHSERVNQVLGPDWFSKAFRNNIYQAYDQKLPVTLPKRRSDQAYKYDVPLTAHGLKFARNTGQAMLKNNIIADVCLSSTALRCIQTCERILKGMDRHEQTSIRIEPGLFECPHLNQNIVDSFMTKKELIDNGYNIKLEYTPLFQKVTVPESLDEYFERSVTVMRGIIDRYGHRGGTILIVTHAPGLLALTDAIKGIQPKHDSFYRTVAAYPPLSMYTAEYDGTKWRYSEEPFNITPHV